MENPSNDLRTDDVPPTFLGLDPPSSRPAAVVVPVPYDGTITWRKGADRGPAALLEASAEVELFDLEALIEPHRSGILTGPPVLHEGDPADLADVVEEVASRDGVPLAAVDATPGSGWQQLVVLGRGAVAAAAAARECADATHCHAGNADTCACFADKGGAPGTCRPGWSFVPWAASQPPPVAAACVLRVASKSSRVSLRSLVIEAFSCSPKTCGHCAAGSARM